MSRRGSTDGDGTCGGRGAEGAYSVLSGGGTGSRLGGGGGIGSGGSAFMVTLRSLIICQNYILSSRQMQKFPLVTARCRACISKNI